MIPLFEWLAGPYRVNGVPLRRVNQNFVIATSTKLDVSTADVAKFDDAYFVTAKEKDTKGEEEFFEGEEEVRVGEGGQRRKESWERKA